MAGTIVMLVATLGTGQSAPMGKRLLATFLWFYAGWYAGAMVAWFLGIHAVLGPILGMAAAALVAFDPRGVIWSGRSVIIEKRIEALASSHG